MPHDIDAAEKLYNEGKILNSLGKHEEAIEYYERAIKINSTFVDAWYNKGKALHEIGKHKEAIRCYEEILKINPNFDETHRTSEDNRFLKNVDDISKIFQEMKYSEYEETEHLLKERKLTENDLVRKVEKCVYQNGAVTLEMIAAYTGIMPDRVSGIVQSLIDKHSLCKRNLAGLEVYRGIRWLKHMYYTWTR